jgi:dTDP-4-amino-4,6-dideoxygalactose transaminase
MIPYSKQEITQQDIDAVVETLKSDFLTQGPKILEFEEKFAKFVGSKYAIAVSNGTAGLHLAAKALNVSKGDKVVTTPITFAASGNCIKYCGGDIIFCDIDEENYIIDIEKLRLILENDKDFKIKGIVVVNFAGYVQNLQKIREIANKHDLWIIEDACHSVGGYFVDDNGNRQYSGSCKFSDVSVFSFHPVKHICCGEGGMVTTNNEDIYRKILKYRTHGITKDKKEFLNDICLSGGDEYHPDWYMEMQDLGFNYRIPDLLCALGQKTLITNYPQYYKLANYFAKLNVPNLGLVLGIYNFQQVFTDNEYSNVEGGVLSALGQLFRDNVKVYIYPYKSEKGHIESLENLKVPQNFHLVFEHLLQNNKVLDVENPNKEILHIYSSKVLQMIVKNEVGWEKMVPPSVAKTINDKCLFGHPCFIGRKNS